LERIRGPMAAAKGAERRVRSKETVTIEGVRVTNKTTNSIMVRKTSKGLEVTNCCLEEQHM